MNGFERWSVRLSSIVVAATGFALLWFKYGLESADPFAVVNHPLQIWALKGHVLVAPLFMLAIGFITVRHIWRHIVRQVQPGRRSGLASVIALVPMTVSGYLIQVVVSDTLRTTVILVHVASSVVFTIGVGFHFSLMWRYVRTSRHETSCSPVRMEEQRARRDGGSTSEDTDDERNSAKRDLAEARRSAG